MVAPASEASGLEPVPCSGQGEGARRPPGAGVLRGRPPIGERAADGSSGAPRDLATFTLDVDGRVSTWNAGAERVQGYASEEILGSHVSRLYVPDDAAAAKPMRALLTARVDGLCEEEGWRVR